MAIMDPFSKLLERASSEIPGHEANRALWDARAELETQFNNVVCYEMVVNENDVWSDFLARTIPRLTEHLSAKGLPMLGGPSALLSVWRGESMFMFSSRQFFDVVRELEQLDEPAFWRQIGAWRSAIGLTVPREALQKSSPIPTARALALGSADVRISDASGIRTDE